MRYCRRCIMPENQPPVLFLNEDQTCSGCTNHDELQKVDWAERGKEWRDLVSWAKVERVRRGNAYDAVLPVSGGKDSHFQAHVCKESGLNVLLFSFNHCFNTQLGNRNLRNLATQFGSDHLRLTMSPDAVRRVARLTLLDTGDLTWHYHSGILGTSMKVAVRYNIPLVLWGEESWQHVGLVRSSEHPEWRSWAVEEYDRRGVDPRSFVGRGKKGHEVRESDLACFELPTQEDVEQVGLRGLYIGSYFPWDALEQAKLVHSKYRFEMAQAREGTFLAYSKLEDHAQDVHNFLRYLKRGTSRATDDASTEIRFGRMNRDEGWLLASILDPRTPSTWSAYLDYLDVQEEELVDALRPMSDPPWPSNEGLRDRVIRLMVDRDRDMEQEYGRGLGMSALKGMRERYPKPYYLIPDLEKWRSMVGGHPGFEVM